MLFTKSMPGLKKINKWTILKKKPINPNECGHFRAILFFFSRRKALYKDIGPHQNLEK